MPTLFLVCPTHRDLRELQRLGSEDRYVTRAWASDALEAMVAPTPPDCDPVGDVEVEVERMVRAARDAGADGVLSTDDYPGAALAAVVAAELGLPGTDPGLNLLCQHKLACRGRQREVLPELVPWSGPAGVVPPVLPCIAKPVKSFFSVGAVVAPDLDQLRDAVRRATVPERFLEPFRTMYERHVGPFGDTTVIVEELLRGRQVTVEGYAYAGEVHVLGVVDSEFYPGTRAFRRFRYPSTLPGALQERVARSVRELLAGLGYAHGSFNVELLVDEGDHGRSGVVEINPRMSSQFADLFEKVDGTNTYTVARDLALGRRPVVRRRAGPHSVAVSHVLRTFEDRTVRSVPGADDLAAVLDVFPDARIEVLCTPGARLSTQMQDGESFRYALVDVGGADDADVDARLSLCLERLPFVLG